MDKTIVTLGAIIVVLGGFAAYMTLGGNDATTEESTGIQIELDSTPTKNTNSEATTNTTTNTADTKVVEEIAVEEDITETEDTTADEAEATTDTEVVEETDVEDIDDTTEKTTDTTEETTTDTTGAIEPTLDWEVTAEYENEDSNELYRVRTDGSSNAIIEYAETADDGYSTVHEFTYDTTGAFAFQADATSFLTLYQNTPNGRQYYLVGNAGVHVRKLDAATGYYYVYGGLDGNIFVVQRQATGDGGVYLNYKDGEEVNCAVYNDQPVDGSTLEIAGTEATFTIVSTAEENAGETMTVDYVEVCESAETTTES